MANLRIKGDTSGYVDLVSPDVAGSQVINLDRLVETNANGQITVSTDTEHQLNVQSATSGAGGSIRVSSTGAYAYNVVQNNSREWRFGSLGGSNFTISDWSAGPTERLVIKSNGNVGIGTTDPQSTLHVNGHMILEGASGVSRTLGFTSANGATGWSIGNGIIDSTHNFRIYDNTAGQARVTVNGSGNVGIGTTNPSSKLNVVVNNNVIEAEIGTVNNGHKFTSQSDVGYDGFQIYQQHGTNQSRNSFSVQDNRTGSKSPAFGIRGDGTVFVGTGAGANNFQNSLSIGRTSGYGNIVHFMDLGAGSSYVDSSNSQYKIRMQINRNAMYYKGVMVELFADSGQDWGGHGFVNYYGRFIVVFRDTTAHTVHDIENHGRNYLQGASTFLYDGTSSFYDSNYYYVDFRFGSNQAPSGSPSGFRPKFSAIGYQNTDLIYAIGVIN